MRISKKQYNELREKMETLEKALNGGKGSGNFGHSGRPGEIGGSGKGIGGSSKGSMESLQKEFSEKKLGEKASTIKEQKKKVDQLRDMLKKVKESTTGDITKDVEIIGRFSDFLKDAETHLYKLEHPEEN